MTAPTITSDAADTTGGEGTAATGGEGQAPTPTEPTTAAGAAGGDTAGAKPDDGGAEAAAGGGGKRDKTERVRSSSRDDEGPQDGDAADGKDGKGGGKDWRVEDLPAGAQKLIADLRKEAGTRRTEAAEAKKNADAASKKAAATDEKFASAVEAFTRALGLTPEPDEPERSPEERLGEITSKYQQSRIELAVYRAAAAHNGDPDALLDSRGFLSKALALDPAADDFDKAIAAAIGDAVAANPKLRAAAPEPARPAAPSGGDFGGGPAGRDPGQMSVDDFRQARRNARGSN